MSGYSMEQRIEIANKSVGKTFGKLLVTEFVGFSVTPSGREVPKVKVRCVCGNEKIVSIWDLRSKKTTTCNLNHVDYEDRTVPAFNNIYNHSYKARAIKAGIPFELTREEFRELCERPCYYCGITPNNFAAESGWVKASKRGIVKTKNFISQWKYNGLDRVVPDKGYTLDNVVPCCAICNHAKHTLSYEDFTAWLDRLVKFRSN